MKKTLFMAAFAAAACLSTHAFAHEARPRHGGVAQSAGDLSFELVNKDGAVTIHVDDHGKSLSTLGATGTLTVLNGTTRTELPLAPGGGNTLVAKGQVKLESGSKAVAAVTLAQKQTISVRFRIR